MVVGERIASLASKITSFSLNALIYAEGGAGVRDGLPFNRNFQRGETHFYSLVPISKI